jgi:hypothetical protein
MSVASNIRYGRRDATDEAVREAAVAALADEFIRDFGGLRHSHRGARHEAKGGGQRQRIAIARALLKNSPILILDEATSQLDTESELLVQSALATLMAGRTVLVIAHRFPPSGGRIKSLSWREAASRRWARMKNCCGAAGSMRVCTNCSSRRRIPDDEQGTDPIDDRICARPARSVRLGNL